MHRFVARFEETTRNAAAFRLDVPGCVSAGIAKDETAHSMRAVPRFHIDGRRAEGLPVRDDSGVKSGEVGALEVA